MEEISTPTDDTRVGMGLETQIETGQATLRSSETGYRRSSTSPGGTSTRRECHPEQIIARRTEREQEFRDRTKDNGGGYERRDGTKGGVLYSRTSTHGRGLRSGTPTQGRRVVVRKE